MNIKTEAIARRTAEEYPHWRSCVENAPDYLRWMEGIEGMGSNPDLAILDLMKNVVAHMQP